MKKSLLTLFAASLFGFVSSCSDADPEVYSEKDGSLAYFTKGTAGSYFVQDVPGSEYLIEVGITTTSSTDRIFEIEVDPESTATPDQYTIDQTTLVIPANSHLGFIKIVGDYANASTAGSKLILNLKSVNGGTVAGFDNVYTLDIFQFCPFNVADFLGTWNADEVGYQVYASEFTQGADTDRNEIIMSNIWDSDPSSQTKVFFNDTNPSNFVLEFPPYTENYLYNNPTYGPAYIDRGSGNFSACAQTVYMKFSVRVSAGFFAPTEIYFSRP